MMSHETHQLWKHIAKESIWGNRGLIKISSLFFPFSVLLTFYTNEIGQGNVTPCALVPFVIGNVKEQPLEQIWRYHTSKLNLVCRGDCLMNIPAEREALHEHASCVADELKSAFP